MGAPTSEVLDMTGRPAEDVETIARRYAAQPLNQRTLGNVFREFVRFMMAPPTPGVSISSATIANYAGRSRRRRASRLSRQSGAMSTIWPMQSSPPQHPGRTPLLRCSRPSINSLPRRIAMIDSISKVREH